MNIDLEDFQRNVGLAGEVIKTTLEAFNLYIAVDSETKEFIFINRDTYHDETTKLMAARIHMEQINVLNNI